MRIGKRGEQMVADIVGWIGAVLLAVGLVLLCIGTVLFLCGVGIGMAFVICAGVTACIGMPLALIWMIFGDIDF